MHRKTANETLRTMQQPEGQRIRCMGCYSEELRSEEHFFGALHVPTRTTWVVRIPSLRTDPVELFLRTRGRTKTIRQGCQRLLCVCPSPWEWSTQLAQYAACLVRRALLRPNPPKPRGSVTMSRIAGSTSGVIWMAQRQRQTP